MAKTPAIVLLVLGSLSSAGCLAKQVHQDGRHFRDALLAMYTDQTMDNLIAASNDLPFVQLSYRNLTITDTLTGKASIGDGSDAGSTRTISDLTGALISTAHNYTNRIAFGGGVNMDRQMLFNADPIVGNREIYEYTIAFAHDPELFQRGCCEPAGPVHVKKKCGETWYWVPCTAAPVFRQLVLKTNFLRGTDTPPPISWNTRIVQAGPRYDEAGQPAPGQGVIKLAYPVPNLHGTLHATLNDKPIKLLVRKLDQAPLGPDGRPLSLPFVEPKETTQLYLITNEVKLAELNLLPVRIYFDEKPRMAEKSTEQKRLDEALKAYRDPRKLP